MSEMTAPLPDEPGTGELVGDLSPAEDALAQAAEAVDSAEQTEAVDMTPLDHPHRLLLVHAHPDDETIGTGATMARYAAEHALVTLVTCTLGELGEIVVPELEHLAADRDDGLGQHRVGELAAACEAMRVTDHRFLGGPGRWRDSGMMGTKGNEDPRAFWQADMNEATIELVRVIREVRPQVVVTYDERGGYGHPDHIQAHRVTMAAFDAAGDPGYAPEAGEPWQAAKLYWTAIPLRVLQQGIDAMQAAGHEVPFSSATAEEMGVGVPDELVTTAVDGRGQLDAKVAAMRAHASQIATDGMFFALADGVGQQAFGVEYYRLVRGERGPAAGPDGREDDLFAGVTS